jgi:hypothetical protein
MGRQTHLRILATQNARVMPESSAPERAWGMPGARCTRSRACSVGSTRVSHHGCTGEPGIPARDGVNGLFRALPGDRALLSPSPRAVFCAKLDASVEASGPHDFAVRITRHSSKAHQRPPHPVPTSVTIAKRPSSGTGCAYYDLIWVKARRDLFFALHLDAWNHVDRAEEISFYAQVHKAATACQAADRRT